MSFDNVAILSDICSHAIYQVDGSEKSLTVDTCVDSKNNVVSVNSEADTKGGQVVVEITHTPVDVTNNKPIVRQTLEFNDSNDIKDQHFKISMTLTPSSSLPIQTNYISPIYESSLQIPYDSKSDIDPRTVLTPFDNDIFSMYQTRSLSSWNIDDWLQMTSSYVSPFYDHNSKKGVVVGSLSHKVWKSGLTFKAEQTKRTFGVKKLSVFGGNNGKEETRDLVDHGMVTSANYEGGSIASPTIYVGFFESWYEGMEDYAINQLDKSLNSLNGVETPIVGWNSWG